jgi:NAD(P)-dependent dehydrogenase (short-subunit alcohol dehydrogenase family)
MSDAASGHWLGLSGRVCVVTGAAGGIGRGIAAGLAQAGARLVLLDRDQAACEDVARALGSADALPIACDISDPDAVKAVAAHVLRDAGPCDVLVNNAALLRAGPIATLSLADWNQLMSVNLTGYLLCSQAFGAQMLSRGKGSIVHTASIAGRHPQPFSGGYSVSKAGVMMLSRQLAVEWGPKGVRSNVVSPGLVRTPMTEAFYQAPGVAERRSAMIPVGRVATPVDIAEVVLFLASDRSGYVNGEDIGIDGGFGRTILGLVPRPGFERDNG